ncbi:hypothetical protein ATO13_14750 [Stappia sp. 22II-S9-Z10]|nr:hypothetical protein ATO13_14750 [Stappia sp. 22II-S9-Z10]
MTDFYSVLQRAVQSLPDGSGPQRRQVYEKARKALIKQLQSFDPPLSSADVTAQRLALEDAIRKIENEIARQNRTRRAVQGALPAGSTSAAARPGAEPRESEAEREARRRAEAERARQEREQMLRSAVSEAMLSPDEDMHAPAGRQAPAQLPAPVDLTHEAIEPAEAHVVGDDFLEQDYDDTVPIVPARRRGRGAPLPPPEDEHIAEAEFEAVDDEGEVYEAVHEDDAAEADPVDPKEEKRRRREEERQLKAERRAERSSSRGKAKRQKEKKPKKGRTAAPTADDGAPRRSLAGRILLPLVVFCLLIGASYAVFTQHERLLAVIQNLNTDTPAAGQERAPVRAAETPVVNKSQARLSGDDEPRAVVAESFTVDQPGDGEDGSGDDITDPAADEGAARTPDGAPQFAPDSAPNAAAEQAEGVGNGPPETDVAAVQEAAPAVASTAAASGDAGEQQAVLYEEAASGGQTGSAVAGTVNWEMVRQSFGGGEEEPVIRAAAVIGERGVSLTMTVRENNDAQLPASHLIELEFDVPASFEGGGVRNVPGIIMKAQEQARGDALRGQAARVSSDLFWVALNNDSADRSYNLDLLANRDWIDIPILYESGRRAILTLRKGQQGRDAVSAALEAWSDG